MKRLLQRIRRILHDRRTRRILTRFVSVTAAIIVFVTTYALVLPAITMELQAQCGIEAHQHDDSCYSEKLVCGEAESPDHHHTDACYEKVLTCEKEVHVHSAACYQTDPVEESAVAASTSSTFTASAASAMEMSSSADSAAGTAGTASPSADNEDSTDEGVDYGFENAGDGLTETPAAAMTDADSNAGYIPQLDPLDFNTVLNSRTGIYYHPVADGEVIEDSTLVPADGWIRIPNTSEQNTSEHENNVTLGRNDLLRVYLAYTIPAGALNSSNPAARYRLPGNIHLTDTRVKAINETVNGIAGQYVDMSTLEILDTEKYESCLGIEAVEGDRRPDESVEDYFRNHPELNGSEYVSATVKVENIRSADGDYEGQDLVFTFTTYSIEKNQHEYDLTGQLTRAGKPINGWITLDININQVDLSEPVITTETVDATNRDTKASDSHIVENEEGVAGITEIKAFECSRQTAEVVFVENSRSVQYSKLQGISTTLIVVEDTVSEKQTEQEDDEGVSKAPTEGSVEKRPVAAGLKTVDSEERAETAEYKDGTLVTEGDGYKITLDYKADARIPENAYLNVLEITEASDKEAYEACLEQVSTQLSTVDEKTKVDETATRFFDIEILADERKVEPSAPLSVNIQLFDKSSTDTLSQTQETPDYRDSRNKSFEDSNLSVLHFSEDGVEKIESIMLDPTVQEKKEEKSQKTPDLSGTTEIQFQAESFSIYGVVYTTISTNVLTADGKTYRITVNFDDDAEIPSGTKLFAKEIEQDSDEFIQHLGQAWAEINKEYLEQERLKNSDPDSLGVNKEIRPINLTEARFFDITLEHNGEIIEPKAPVKVEIKYVDGLKPPVVENPIVGVAHFVKDESVDENGDNAGTAGTVVELIEEVETEKNADGNIVEFAYQQSGFSAIGTYVGQVTIDSNPLSFNPTIKLPMMTKNNTRGTVGIPEASKTLEENKDEEGNEDGTYTLSLSVTGQALEYTGMTKANVLFIMDRSSSMLNKVYDEYIGVPQSNITYYGQAEDGSIVSLFTHNSRYYNGKWVTYYPPHQWPYTQWEIDLDNEYTGTVYTQSDKTRLQVEQKAMETLIGSLLDYNDDNPGTIEISIVSFADTTGNNKTGWNTEVGWTDNENDLLAAVREDDTETGTNWEESLKYALSQLGNISDDRKQEDTFVIFLTDGEPTAISGEYMNHYYYDGRWQDGDGRGAHHFISASDGSTVLGGFDYAYEPTRDDARAIVDAGYKFYSIMTFNPLISANEYLRRLTNYAYDFDGDKIGGVNGQGSFVLDPDDDVITGGDILTNYYYGADKPDDLTTAFENIFKEVSQSIAHGQVKITDGMTAGAMTSTFVSGSTEGVRYAVTDADGTELYNVTTLDTDDPDNPIVTFTINGVEYSTSETDSEKKVNKITNDDPDAYDKGTYYSVIVNNKEYKMALANISASPETKGELTWDLTPVGTLWGDCTYTAEFIVWPNQAAYDYVAGLNNELPDFEWDESVETDDNLVEDSVGNGYWPGGVEGFPSIVKYKGSGIYAVLTNTHQELNYSIVTTVDGGEPNVVSQPEVKLGTPDPMPLTASETKIEKQWNVKRDPGILFKMLYAFDENGNPVPTKFNISFDILQDAVGAAGDNGSGTGSEGSSGPGGEEDIEGKDPYTTVKLGWTEDENGENGHYVWDTTAPNSTETIRYNGVNYTIGTSWPEDFSIATGLMLSTERMDELKLDKSAYPSGTYKGKTYYVLETGHDYTIRESDIGYEFDFLAPTFHPMLVDGTLQSVNYTKNYAEDGVTIESVNITKMTDDDGGISSLKIENTLRGYIKLDKDVVDLQGNIVEDDDTKFEYNFALYNDSAPFVDTHIPWYGISDLFYHDENFNYYQAEQIIIVGEDGVAVPKEGELYLRDEDGNEYTALCEGIFDPDIIGPTEVKYKVMNEEEEEEEITIQLYGNQMTPSDGSHEDGYTTVEAILKISQNETLSIANIPFGTRYTIVESEKVGYQLKDISKKIGDNDAESLEDISTRTITDIIVANTDNNIKFTNERHKIDINIEKVDEEGKDLAGVIFQLQVKNKSANNDNGNEMPDGDNAGNMGDGSGNDTGNTGDVPAGEPGDTGESGGGIYQPAYSVEGYKEILFNSGKTEMVVEKNEDGELQEVTRNVQSIPLEEVTLNEKTYTSTFTTTSDEEDDPGEDNEPGDGSGESPGGDSSIESPQKSIMRLEGLPDGEYKLVELKAPDGYVILVNQIYFKIEEGVMSSATATDEETADKVNLQIEEGKLPLLTIKNEKGAELPSAGGPGTKLIYLLGGMLLATAVILLGRKWIKV